MPWQCFRWIWRLEAPLHVGMAPAGALNRTRPYIPARAIWGALTAELARRQSPSGFPNYHKLGQKLQQGARFTYLYPAEEVRGEWHPWLPRYEQGEGLVWVRQNDGEKIRDRKFRKRLLAAQPSTAIEPGSDTAHDGTLREMEYVLPHWRCTASPVAFVGYVFVKDNGIATELRDIDALTVGGESRYGFGRLRLDRADDQKSECFGVPTALTGHGPTLKLESQEAVLAHTLPKGDPIECGAFELVLGWNVGSLFSGACEAPCWTPGSRVKREACFQILESGFWSEV